MNAPDQVNEGQRLLASRMRGADDTPASAAAEAQVALGMVPDTLGIRQCLEWLRKAYPNECAKKPELLSPEISDDNKLWQVKGSGSGNAVELTGRVMNIDDVKAAAAMFNMVDGLSEEERVKLKPGYEPEPGDLNPFPLDDMPRVMRDLAVASAEINQSMPELSVVTMLGVLSAALGKGIELKTTKGRCVSGNLMMIVSMPTGSGKTSEAGPLLDMVHEYQRKRRHDHRKQGYRKQAALSVLRREIEKLENAASSDEEPADKAQFDADMERLFDRKDDEAAPVTQSTRAAWAGLALVRSKRPKMVWGYFAASPVRTAASLNREWKAWADCCGAPSRPTCLPPARPQRGVASMCSTARRRAPGWKKASVLSRTR